jgi:hypothetical protein
MHESIFNIVVISSIASGLIPLLIYPFCIRPLPSHNRAVLLIAIIAILADIVLYLTAKVYGSNHIPANIFLAAHFVAYTIYYHLLMGTGWFRFLLGFGTLVYASSVITSVHLLGTSTFHNYTWAVGNTLLSVYGIAYLSQISRMPLQRYIDRHLYSNLIVNFSVVAYFTATLFMVLVSNYVFTQLTPNEGRLFWSFHNLVNILKNIGLAVGLYYSGRREPYITLEQLERIATSNRFMSVKG